jgi:cytochrome c-type biogenesis protein CcmE
MKKSYVIAIVVIAVAISVIVSTIGDASSYVSFEEAKVMATEGKDTKIHVVGMLNKDEHGNPVGVEISEDKLSFAFEMLDQNQNAQKVVYHEPVPADFFRSEQIVVIGSDQGDYFLADKILMKCPSKYQETEI